MSRLLMIGAMVLSLWPAAALAVSFATPDDTSTSNDSSTQIDRPSTKNDETPGREFTDPEPDIAGYNALNKRMTRLLKRLDRSSAARGQPDHKLAASATALGDDFAIWDSDNPADLDQVGNELARRQERLADTVAAFAKAPTQARLSAMNKAISRYNELVPQAKQ